MTLEQARTVAGNPTTYDRSRLALALDVLRRELDRREAAELERQRVAVLGS